MKLRLYPGIAPMLVMPAMFMFQGIKDHGGPPFGVAIAAGLPSMVSAGMVTVVGATGLLGDPHATSAANTID